MVETHVFFFFLRVFSVFLLKTTLVGSFSEELFKTDGEGSFSEI